MLTRPTYKRAARSSFSVPQAPARRLRLDTSDVLRDVDDNSSSTVSIPQAPAVDVQDARMQYSDHQDTTEPLSEFPFPQQLQFADALQNPRPMERLTLNTTHGSAFSQMRPTRIDSWSSECSPLSYVSPMPSLASSELWSPSSPATPQTPADVFNTVEPSLEQLVMADDLGMTLDEIKELDRFAALSVAGSEKRGGRVLPHSPTQQRRSSASSRRFSRRSSIRSDRKGSLPYSRPRLQSIEEWTNQVDDELETKDWWKEVNWSRFSDSSSSSMSDSDLDALAEEPTRRPELKRRSSSYRGCIFLPDNHGHKMPYLGETDAA